MPSLRLAASKPNTAEAVISVVTAFEAVPVGMGMAKARVMEAMAVSPTPGVKINVPMMVAPVRVAVGAGAVPIMMMAAHGGVIVAVVMRTVAVGEAIGRHPRTAVMIAGSRR